MRPIGLTSTVLSLTHSGLLCSQTDETPGSTPEHFKSDPAFLGVVALDGTKWPQMDTMDGDSGHPFNLHTYSWDSASSSAPVYRHSAMNPHHQGHFCPVLWMSLLLCHIAVSGRLWHWFTIGHTFQPSLLWVIPSHIDSEFDHVTCFGQWTLSRVRYLSTGSCPSRTFPLGIHHSIEKFWLSCCESGAT